MYSLRATTVSILVLGKGVIRLFGTKKFDTLTFDNDLNSIGIIHSQQTTSVPNLVTNQASSSYYIEDNTISFTLTENQWEYSFSTCNHCT